MRHLDDGELRRLLDQTESLGEAARDHLARCTECRAREATIGGNAQTARAALQGTANAHPGAAFDRIERALAERPATAGWYLPGGLAAAAAFALALVFTPLGGYANAFLTIFQPKEFVPIDVSSADFRELRFAPQAKELGTLRVVVAQHRTTYATLAAARKHLAFSPRVPGGLPAGIGAGQSFSVATPSRVTYTFSAAKARAFAAKSRKTLPPMPAALNGTTVRVSTGEIFAARYGQRATGDEDRSGIAVFEMPVPTVTSTGASFQDLERYMLTMPGISPDLAAQLRALGDLQDRMPILVDTGKRSAQRVAVDGVQGLGIGDNTGLGAGVMWQKAGMLYAVYGESTTMDQILATANGLH